MYFIQYFKAVGLKLVLVLVFIRLTMNQRLLRYEKSKMFLNQKWEMFRNLVDLASKLRFYEINTWAEYVEDILKCNC